MDLESDPRFRDMLLQMKEDLGLSPSASAEEVHAKCCDGLADMFSPGDAFCLQFEPVLELCKVGARAFKTHSNHVFGMYHLWLAMTEVTISRFFAWEITFWKWSPCWTILLKVYRFRKRLQGKVEAGEARRMADAFASARVVCWALPAGSAR